jgi:hypothetical protein
MLLALSDPSRDAELSQLDYTMIPASKNIPHSYSIIVGQVDHVYTM